MSEPLALGQRTGKMILVDGSWSAEEIQMLAEQGVTIDEVVRHWVLVGGDDTLNAAIGAVKQYVEPGTTPAEVPQQPEDAVAPVENVNELVSEESDLTCPPETTL